MHINNSGLRTIGRILGVSFQLVAYWIKTGTERIKKIKEEMNKCNNNINNNNNVNNKVSNSNNNNDIDNNNNRNIRILEMDELFTYVKKNQKIKKEKLILIKEYGLLLIGIKEN